MKLDLPQIYEIQIDDDSYQLSQGGLKCKFSSPASTNGIAKLYTVTQKNTLLYVGISKQRISARLRYGFKSTGKNGYHGYKWKKIREPLILNIWTAKDKDTFIDLKEIEKIEAEVVYLCRRNSGQWPTHQNEIHFHSTNKVHRRLAQEIYSRSIG